MVLFCVEALQRLLFGNFLFGIDDCRWAHLLHHLNQLLIQVLFVFCRIVLVKQFSIELLFVTWCAHEMNVSPRMCWIRFYIFIFVVLANDISKSTLWILHFVMDPLRWEKYVLPFSLHVFFLLISAPSVYMERKPVYFSVFTFQEKQSSEEQNESKKIQHFYGFCSLDRIVWNHFVENRVKKY